MSSSEWRKYTKSTKLDEGTKVEVMFKNGVVLKATVRGNFCVFNPLEVDYDALASGISKYRIVE